MALLATGPRELALENVAGDARGAVEIDGLVLRDTVSPGIRPRGHAHRDAVRAHQPQGHLFVLLGAG
eukprot:3574742-Lingulodinium_polyedra.AAC.1